VLAVSDGTALVARSVAAEPTATATAGPDAAGYLKAVHASLGWGSYYVGVDDDYLTRLGPAVCSAIDRGVSKQAISTAYVSSPLDKATLTAVVGAATTYLCPEHAGF
jgi:hypothetical protein